jgi:hypothetical protein
VCLLGFKAALSFMMGQTSRSNGATGA